MGSFMAAPDSDTRTARACVQGRCVCERGRGGRDLRAACPRRGGGGCDLWLHAVRKVLVVRGRVESARLEAENMAID